ncbi:hypothetical protein [Mycobacterium lepromatosis]
MCCTFGPLDQGIEGRLLPWVLAEMELDDNTTKIGPRYGALSFGF